MNLIEREKNSQLWQTGWHFLFAGLTAVAVVCFLVAAVLKGAELNGGTNIWLKMGASVMGAAFLTGFFAVLLLLFEATSSIKENNEKLDNIAEMINRNRTLLSQIAQGIRLSDISKEIAFRDTERMELAEAVLGKLHQHDFDSADAMIQTLSARPEYKGLSDQLRKIFEKYRNATEDERINQVIAHIDKLCQQQHWVQAVAQIDNLVKTFPHSDKARAMIRRLQEKKDARKKELLAAWDHAVTGKDTDRSLRILKELDTYLTPSEALALQESAKTVFRTKLHNLGVQFALAVTEKDWAKALATGKHIVSEFPNSKMAQEIRAKMDVLHENARH